MKPAGKLTYAAAVKLEVGQFLKCEAVPGLELRAGKTSKSFSFYYRNAEGTRRRPHLGNFPALSIEAARDAAKDILSKLAKFEDPSADKAALRTAPTVNDLADKLEARAKREYAPETQKLVERLMRHYIRPRLGNKKVASVTVSECSNLLNDVAAGKVMIEARSSRPDGKPGKITKRLCVASTDTAKSVKTYGSKMFAMAESDSLKWRIRNTNPFNDEDTPEFPDSKREVHIAENEFAAVNHALMELSAEYPWHVAALYTELFIGSRVTELATAMRDWLKRNEAGDLDLVLSKHKTSKKIGAKKIHITPAAEQIIMKLPVHPNGYIFGPLAELSSPRRAIWAVWDKARDAAKIRKEVRVQDIRRTFASVARTNGASIGDIQPLLQHANSKTTERYAFIFNSKTRQLADDTADSIQKKLNGPSAAVQAKKLFKGDWSSALRFARVRRRA